MLKDDYPITLHKPEEQTVPGFYVRASDSLDICSEHTMTLLRWYFNGNETDLKDLSCYVDGELFCSGVQLGERREVGICSNFHLVIFMLTLAFMAS
ncbi:unnamed protein product [Dibothriocephalus latus]|uniref:Uncharacterized protein n=1 Tax=Dibothriocephalus latus TaxID=60516 RepID=A0A3P6P764_DIBLA|nr:unnamed protein product [Dibothriocephalus latus]